MLLHLHDAKGTEGNNYILNAVWEEGLFTIFCLFDAGLFF